MSTVTPFPGTVPGQHQPPRLLDRVRIAIRTRHYSLRPKGLRWLDPPLHLLPPSHGRLVPDGIYD